MSKQYSFIDANIFDKFNDENNLFLKQKELKNIDDVGKNAEFGILDPQSYIVKVKNVKKGELE